MFKTFLFETAPTLHLQYRPPFNLYLLIFHYLLAELTHIVLIKIINKFINKLQRFPRREGKLHTDKVPLKELELHHFGKGSLSEPWKCRCTHKLCKDSSSCNVHAVLGREEEHTAWQPQSPLHPVPSHVVDRGQGYFSRYGHGWEGDFHHFAVSK